ncbi:MAG: shikimate dehydrogenase [Clostridia bacterium]|nr:shikimate dehydrogenase [Clostridia bacterium]
MKYGVIGEHLKHSFSKEIHERIGGYGYDVCEVEPDKVESLLKAAEFSGINVTIPYKEKVIPYLYSVSDRAMAIGAVNTVVNKDGRLYGYNTDYMGLKSLIERNKIDLRGKKAVILGNGGTAKTGYFVLSDMGAKEIVRVGRSKDGADVTYEELMLYHSDAEFILNTTPVGMYPKNEGKIINVKDFPNLKGLIDVVYNPIRTNLTLEAAELGIPSESGLYMLVSQAVYASEIFTGQKYGSDLCDKVFKEILKKKENIVLIGMPSSGKTTVGKYLSKVMEREFIDTDEEIIKKIGMDIPSYFAKYGEDSFRQVECDVISDVSKSNGKIISTGGGCILRHENVVNLKQNGRIYFLNRSIDLLTPTSSRPLASDRAAIKRRFEERYEIYKLSADCEIEANGTVEQVGSLIREEFYK